MSLALPELNGAPRLPEVNQVLEPFQIDVEWLPDYFPETIGMADVLTSRDTALEEILDVQVERVQTEKIDLGRKLMRTNDQMAGSCLDSLIRATANLLDNADDSEDREAKVRELLGPHLKDAYAYELTIQNITEDISLFTQLLQDARHHTYSFVESLQHNLDNDTSLRYGLAKLVASIDYDPAGVAPQDTFVHMLAVQAVEQNGGLLTEVYEELKSGAFDHLIAEDLLLHAESGEAGPQLDHLKNLQELIKACAPETAQEVLRDRLVDNLDHWPADVKLSLVASRTALINDIGQKMRKGMYAARDYGFIGSLDDAKERFDIAIDELILLMTRKNSIENTPASRAQAVKANIESKRRRSKLARTAVNEVELTDETVKEPRTLTFFDTTSGIFYGHDDPKFIDIIQSYTDKYQGVPGIMEDIDRVLQFVSQLDFSKGPIRGVKQYSWAFKTADGEVLNGYGFKVSDAVGLPTSAKSSKKLRVLFIINEDKIGILALGDRANIPTIERRLGVATGVSG